MSSFRIATWNTFNNPNDPVADAHFATVFQAIGEESAAGIAKPLDLLVLTESDPPSDLRMEAVLDSLYATDQFMTVTSGVDGGGDTTGFIYDARTLQLLEQQELLGPLTHNTMRGRFRPIATSGEADFFVYAVHLKSGGTSANQSLRAVEMNYLRADADALGAGASVIFAGDFNISGSNEMAWSEIVAAGTAQAFDAANAPGQWSGNGSFVDVHTYSSFNMQSRYDFQFITSELQDGTGFEYIAGTNRAFGNNGSHGLGNPITAGSGAASNVLQSLVAASDHLPVVADYEIVAQPGLLLTQSFGNSVVTEGGLYDTYTLELATIPEADVTISVVPNSQLDLGAGPGSLISLTFHPDDQLLEQTIVVRAVDDNIAEGTHSGLIQHSVQSLDMAYAGLTIDEIVVEVRDNDAPTLIINELDSDTPGTDTQEFIELFDGGVGNVALDDFVLVLFNGSNDTSYRSMDLDGFTTDNNGYFVVGNSAVPNVGLVFSDGLLQNGADAVALYRGNAASFSNGSPVTVVDLVDALVYDTNDADDPGLLALLNAGQQQIDESSGGNSANDAIARVPDYGTSRNTDNYRAQAPTPGLPNFLYPAGVRIKQGGQRTDVTEGGPGDIYTVVLTTIPTAEVIVSVLPDAQLDVGNGVGVSMELVFTPESALIPQTVFVSAADDTVFEGDHTGVIVHTLQSQDARYAALVLPIIVVNVTDNETRYLVINEIDSDTPSVDTMEFIELYDGGVGGTPLDNLVVVLFNGSNDTQYAAFDLDGYVTDENGFFLIGSDQIPNYDLLLTSSLQNGADAVALYEGNASQFVQVTTDNLIDALVYGTNDPDDPGLLTLLLPGEAQANESGNGDPTLNALARVPDGGEPRRTSTYVAQPPTPGTWNQLNGDFDHNLLFDCADINALGAAIASGSTNLAFDLTRNSIVDGGDLDLWLQLAGAVNLGPGRSYLRGDGNLDGFVDGVDFINWNSHKFTTDGSWCTGDFTSDGVVDGQDFISWNANKFMASDQSSATRYQLTVPATETQHEHSPRRTMDYRRLFDA